MHEKSPILREFRRAFRKVIQRKTQTPGYLFLLALARSSHINEHRRLARGQKLRRERSTQPFGENNQVRTSFQTLQTVLQISSYVIKPDAPQPDG